VVLSGDATATTDTYSVRVLDNEPANDSTNGFVDRSWVVGEETAGGSELTVTSQWNGSNELTGFDRTNSAVGLTTDGGMNYLWALYGAAAGSDPYTQTGSGFSSVGTFAVATNLDPIGHWPMDDLSGTTVTDVSGNNLDGLRVNGSDWSTNGKIDGAASFDGINDYAEIPDDDLLDPGADDFTVSFWVYKREATLGWDNAWGVNKWNTGGSPGTNEFSLALTAERNSDKPMFVIESGNTKYSAVSPEEISLNEWHLLTGVREGSQIKLYVDGQLKQTTNVGSASVNNLGISLRIANSQMNKHYADAMIDDVRFYDFALSETKIEELFTSVNNAPVVDAGEDQTIISPVNTANLSGSVVDDGLPADSSLTIEWSLVSGPGNVVFADSSQPITTATFSAEGVYLLELAASDGELTSSDTMEVAVLSKAPPPSPIGHWPMDDLTGTTVTDVSGNNLDGELINGAQWTTNGIINGAASFDGINDYAEIPDDELLDPGADDFTVSFWVYKREPTLGWDNVWGVNKWNTGAAGGTNEWTLSLAGSSNSDHAAFIIESGTTLFSAKSPDDIPLNEWHLITGVRENDEIKLYVDSVLKATTFIGNVSVNNVGRKVRIANSQLNNHYTDGMFDDVRIYDVALNSDEVDSLFNLGAMNKRLPVAATIEVLSDLRIYPNPVLTTTTIDFNLQATERVTMGIFDERGQLVEMLVDDNLPEGTHRMKWDASPVSRGVYILRAMVGQQLYHKKIVKQ
jgi:hypothetical protein